MRKLIVRIEASVHEVDLDNFYDEGEELNNDVLSDDFIHEIVTQPNYTWEVVEVDE